MGRRFRGPRSGHLVRYDLANDRAEAVLIPAFEFSLTVNRDGVLGGRDIDGGVIYSDRIIQLPPLPGGFGAEARTIDDTGHPAGTASTSDGVSKAVRWRCDLG